MDSGAAGQDEDVVMVTPEGKGSETMSNVKARVSELEKECMSMKQEIRRLGKPRRSWSILTRKCGFGAKVQQAQADQAYNLNLHDSTDAWRSNSPLARPSPRTWMWQSRKCFSTPTTLPMISAVTAGGTSEVRQS